MSLKIATLNVRGIREVNKRKSIMQKLYAAKVDIACLQETHMLDSDKEIWKNQWGLNPTNDELIELETCKLELNNLDFEKTKASIFRSRARWYREGEKNSRYYFNLEKRNYNQKVMTRIYNNDRKLLSKQKDILQEQHRFYKELYTADTSISFQLTNDSDLKIMQCDKDMLDKPISLEELSNAVRSLKKSKTPGLDGLTSEFYQYFWPKLAHMYLRALNECNEEGELYQSAKRGVISLLPKKKDPLYLKNWRPLTMLNTDYKILAKVLAERLKQVLPYLISMDQTGFMENRQISTTIRQTLDAIDYIQQRKLTGYLLSLDFEKCFDKIEYGAIRGALRYFDIGENFISWTNLLLYKFESCTVNNGNFSEFFEVTRSTHQGDPIAPYLYLLTGEVMAIEIRKCKNIQKLKIYEILKVISQFADDTQIFSEENRTSLEAIVDTLEKIRTNTGLTVNYEKSKIHLLGNAQKLEIRQAFQWDPGGPDLLGIDTNMTADAHFSEILKKVESTINTWYNRQATVYAKIMIVNTLLASLYTYRLQVIENPSPKMYKQFNEIISRYLWKNKRPKIKLELLQAPKYMGGLKLVNLELRIMSMKVGWLFKEDDFVKEIIDHQIPHNMGILFLDCNPAIADIKNILSSKAPLFWVEVFEAWFCLKDTIQACDIENVGIQALWYNKHIQINHQYAYIDQLCRSGICTLNDIWDSANDDFYTLNTLSRVYECDFSKYWLQYKSLCNAIPKEWINWMSSRNAIREINLYSDVLLSKKRKTAYIYNQALEKISETVYIESLKKLNKRLRSNVDRETYLKAFKNIYLTTNVTKYRDFQYRMLVNNLYFNDQLYHWKKKDTQKCDYCPELKQNMFHIYWECKVVLNFWKELITFFEIDMYLEDSELTTFHENWTIENLILNTVMPKPGHIVNMILLVAKRYIFSNKCTFAKHKKIPNFREFLHLLESHKSIEFYNAHVQGKQQYCA